MSNIAFDFDVQVRGKARSEFTAELVNRRLAALKQQPESAETRREIEYLEALKVRKGW